MDYNPFFIVQAKQTNMRQTALIVEDDPGTRHVLSATLGTAGIDCIHAETGAAMWQRLEEKPDVIILDLSLPDADGWLPREPPSASSRLGPGLAEIGTS